MALLEKQLFTKRSGIPAAGKGLFIKKYITKGTRIAEYKGRITTWKKVLHDEVQTKVFNRYLFYINRYHVINPMHNTKALTRYANDARGLTKIKGLVNNCKYVKVGQRVFIEAVKVIPAGTEILISYESEYWDVIKQDNKLDLKRKTSFSKAKK